MRLCILGEPVFSFCNAARCSLPTTLLPRLASPPVALRRCDGIARDALEVFGLRKLGRSHGSG